MYARRGLCRYVGAPPTPPVATDSTTAQDLHAFSFCDQLEQLALVQRHPFLHLHSRYAFALYTRSISHRTREEARLVLRRYRNGHLCLGACMMCVCHLCSDGRQSPRCADTLEFYLFCLCCTLVETTTSNAAPHVGTAYGAWPRLRHEQAGFCRP